MTAETAPVPDPVLVDTKQAAAALGISPRQVERLRASGRFGPRPIRLGRRCLRFELAEIRAWVRADAPPAEIWPQMKPIQGD